MEWIKQHPYLTGGLVLGLIVLFFVFRRAAGSAPPQQSGYGPVQTASAQGASPSAVQQSSINAAVAMKQLDDATQLQIKQLDVQQNLQNIVTSGQVQLHAQDSALAAVQAQTGGQVQIASIGANRDVAIEGLQSQTQQEAIAEDLAKQQVISQAQTDQAGIAADVAKTLGGYAAGVQMATIGATKDVDLATLNAEMTVSTNQQNQQTQQLEDLVGLQENLAAQKYAAGSAYIPAVGGSQNRTSIIESIFGDSAAAVAAQQSEAAQNQPFNISNFIPPISFSLIH